MSKIHVLLTFGGYIDEHETTVMSASNILPNIDPEKYLVDLLYINKQGEWFLCDKNHFKIYCDDADELISSIKGKPVFLKIGDSDGAQLVDKATHQSIPFDVVFSLLTNRYGNDGASQGLWSVANIPHTGPSIISAAIGLDKDVAKRLIKEAGLPICQYNTFSRETLSQTSLDEIKQMFGMPFFMKPSSSGSSIGVHKIIKDSDFPGAVDDIFAHDEKLIIEEYIEGSELEVYCLGCGNGVKTTLVNQVIVENDFYTYEAKYLGKKVTQLLPAAIPEKDRLKAQQLAIKTYQVLEGRGVARVDLFYSKDGCMFVSEINTSPAFVHLTGRKTPWPESGVPYPALVDLLITAALE